jgi:hypothetical protein
LATTPAILIEGFGDFPQCLQANARIVHQLGYSELLPVLSSLSSIILAFDAV